MTFEYFKKLLQKNFEKLSENVNHLFEVECDKDELWNVYEVKGETIMNIFEIAAKNKFRFPFNGIISTEDLYSLSLESLDSIFKTLNSELKKSNEESLLNVQSTEDKTLDTKIQIIIHIANEKLLARDAKLKEKLNKEQK